MEQDNQSSGIAASELILNEDGSIYHLSLLPGDIANTIFTVGDPDRVSEVSKHFDSIELKKGKREFITHTGYLNNKRFSVISTGIGTDNIDIVFNELDALVNVDFNSRRKKNTHKSLNIIRIGTSAAVNPAVKVDSFLASRIAVGLDTLAHFYDLDYHVDEIYLMNQVKVRLGSGLDFLRPYACYGSESLLSLWDEEEGITLTAPGFYAPQNRSILAKPRVKNYVKSISDVQLGHLVITNLEMETAGIYALAKALKHNAVSYNAILANRTLQTFSINPKKTVGKLIEKVLEIHSHL